MIALKATSKCVCMQMRPPFGLLSHTVASTILLGGAIDSATDGELSPICQLPKSSSAPAPDGMGVSERDG